MRYFGIGLAAFEHMSVLWSRVFKLLISMVLVVAAFPAFATLRTTDFAFQDGGHIEVKNDTPTQNSRFNFIRRFFGKSRILYFKKGDAKGRVLASRRRGGFFLVPSDLAHPQFDGVLMTTEGAVKLILPDGGMASLPMKGPQLNSWRGALLQDGGALFFISSVLTSGGELRTLITRLSDDKTVLYAPLYFDFQEGRYAAGADGTFSMGNGTPVINLRRFDDLAVIKDIEASVIQDKAQRLRGRSAVAGIIANHMKQKVFGQDHLVERFAHYVVNRPVSGRPVVLSVTGPSGVGKTLLGQVFAGEAFGEPNHFYEMNGTKYTAPITGGNIEHHNEFGAPAGQQGRQKGGLIEKMKETDGRLVVQINEADKMHPDMWKMLMEFLDRGYVKSGDGLELHAKELYVVLTSNRGAQEMFPPSVESWSRAEVERRLRNLDSDAVKALYMRSTGAADKFQLPREVINRVTEWLAAAPISQEAAIQIAADSVAAFNRESFRETGVIIQTDDDVIRHLALTNFKSSDDGRQIRNQVIRALSEARQVAGSQWALVEGARLQLSLSSKKGAFEITWPKGPAEARGLRVRAPLPKEDNPLADTENVAAIRRLEPVLKKRLVGQDSAVRSTVYAITAQRGDPGRKRPVSLVVVGSTGTGKTELGRGIAEALYGSAERANVISLGNVMNEANLNKIFGSDPGYQGSDTTREFEQALLNNPEGGVIVFDDFSNMGGGRKEMKEALIKKLYEMTEEGRWTSPVNNRSYDLSQYVFLFTGNDGERLFQGVTSEDMRLAIWKENNAREKVRDMLVDAGVPEAFLNRMADLILFKPLTRSEMDFVVKKLLTERVRKIEAQYPGVRVQYAANFIRQLADSFFLSERGGRSVRDIIEDRLPAAITFAFLESDLDLQNPGALRGLSLQLSMSDNLTAKPYVRSGAPERLVTVNVRLARGRKVLAKRFLDLTEFAAAKKLMHIKEAAATAYHEAGHAVVNDPAITGEKLVYVSIVGGKMKDTEYLGYARYDKIPGHQNLPTRASVVIRIGQLYAGSLAQAMAGYPQDAGWSNDLEKIRRIATQALLDWGFEKSLLSVRVDKDGRPDLSPQDQVIFKKKMDALIEEGRRYAEHKLIANWGFVRVLTAELLRSGHLDESRFNELTRGQVSRRTRVSAKPVRSANGDCEKYLTGSTR